MNISSSKKPIILQFVGGKKINHSNIKRTTKIGYKKARSFEIGLFLRLRRIGRFNGTIHISGARCASMEAMQEHLGNRRRRRLEART